MWALEHRRGGWEVGVGGERKFYIRPIRLEDGCKRAEVCSRPRYESTLGRCWGWVLKGWGKAQLELRWNSGEKKMMGELERLPVSGEKVPHTCVFH